MARTETGGAIIRRSIEIHPKTDMRLQWLMNELEATSVTELVRRSLQVFETLIRDEKDGRHLYVEDEQGRLTRVSMRYSGMNTAKESSVAKVVALSGYERNERNESDNPDDGSPRQQAHRKG
jgi:hypothetical protein